MINRTSPLTQQRLTPKKPIPGITFRLAQPQDLPALQENCYPETERRPFQDHYSYLLRWQKNGRCAILIAETHFPTIIGSGQLIRRGDTAEIAELSVHPGYRNQGIGTALIDILTQIARQQKTSILEIGAEVNNQAALRLYRRLGFGRNRLLNLPTGQKAIILNKSLARRNRLEI